MHLSFGDGSCIVVLTWGAAVGDFMGGLKVV
jgi:hypothetical protein